MQNSIDSKNFKPKMPEHQNIEWKESWRDEYLKWICGFANTNGGKLYIGIDDKGNVTGINNYQTLLKELPNKFRDVLGVFAEVNLHSKNNKHYLEIIVPRYDIPISLRGKYYIRTGSTLQELKGPSLNEFILKRTGKTWDDILEKRASINDIDEATVRLYLKDTRESKRINIEPEITDEAISKIKSYYHEMRSMYGDLDEEKKKVAITHRQLESLIRLSEASARMKLNKKVGVSDAENAISLMNHTLESIGMDPDSNEIDVDIWESGESASQREKVNQVIDVISDADDSVMDFHGILERTEFGKDELRVLLEKMKGNGDLIELGSGEFRVPK